MNILLNRNSTGMHASRQKGMSIMSWVMVLVLGGIGANLGFKTVPHYVDFRAMCDLIATSSPEEIDKKSSRSVHSYLTKRFKINNLRDYKLADIVEIERTKTGTILNLHYIVTEHITGNADLTMTFDKTFEFSAPRY